MKRSRVEDSLDSTISNDDVATLRAMRAASSALQDAWPEEEDPEDWIGVMPIDGRVIALDLTAHDGGFIRLSSFGCLPAEIGHLKALKCITLQNCSLLSSLPAEIGQLENLEKLDLGGCSSLSVLPESVGGLPELTHLNLSRCSSLSSIPHLWGCTKLEELDLSFCSSLLALPEGLQELLDDHCLKVIRLGALLTPSNSF